MNFKGFSISISIELYVFKYVFLSRIRFFETIILSPKNVLKHQYFRFKPNFDIHTARVMDSSLITLPIGIGVVVVVVVEK